MKLLFLKQKSLTELKGNIKANIANYQSENSEWVYDICSDPEPFLEFKLDVREIKLRTDFETAAEMDLYNCKSLYSNLKMLSETQAVDERLWSGLAHSVFYDFVQKRWSHHREEENMKKENYILSRYFYGSGGDNRGILRNTLSKLWWMGKFTYDDSRSNPFELTDVVGSSDAATRVNDLFSRNFSRNPVVCHAFLSAIKEYEDAGCKIGGYTYRKIVEFMNAFGGITIVDALEEHEMKDILMKKLSKILSEKGNPDTSAKVYILSENCAAALEEESSDKLYSQIRKISLGDTITVQDTTSDVCKQYKIQSVARGKAPVVQEKCMGQVVGFTYLFNGILYKVTRIE